MHKYAGIIVDIASGSVDRPFTYMIPEQLEVLCRVGTFVMVPFGRGNKQIGGYVTEISDTTAIPIEKLKEISEIPQDQNHVESKLIALAFWIKKQYGATMITALKLVLPVKKKYQAVEKRSLCLLMNQDEAVLQLQEYEKKHQTARARLLEELVQEKVLDYQLVTARLHVTAATIRSLETAGILRIETECHLRNPLRMQESIEKTVMLNEQQNSVVSSFITDYKSGVRKTYLLYGITGSGKTEVYIHMIQEVIAQKKQVIMLIPEIALSYQTVKRFYRYFGERVSILNSSLSPGEKYDQCERARRGEIDIIIGPRSALFTPFEHVGLIILDEEHEGSYKNETMPRYHAREVAIQLAAMHHASVVLGSATPCVESYYHALKGDYQLLTLDKRAGEGELANVHIVDLRRELREGNRLIFSRLLLKLIEERLDKKEQVMLFINRRGYAGFVSCRACGLVLKCPHCDVSLSEHNNGKMICHYCGYEMVRPATCPSCNSPYLLGFKAGTQQVEEQIKKIFPKCRTLRMDSDTTQKKNSYNSILNTFANEEADIMIGTQMIVKGHDFSKVTLVGVLAADLSLAANDFRAGERTFQLLTQAAGRAGRGERKGEVVIQTYQPQHYSIVYAQMQDYRGFYEEEMLYRELSMYPPVFEMLAVMTSGKSCEETEQLTNGLAAVCRKKYGNEICLIGPAGARILKVNDYFRFVFYIKSREKQKLTMCRETMEAFLDLHEKSQIQVQFDFNPMNSF